MPGVDLNSFFVDEAEIRIEMDVIIGNVFGNSQSAEIDKVFDSILEFVDLVLFDPLLELGIDGDCFLLKDEGGSVKVEIVLDA